MVDVCLISEVHPAEDSPRAAWLRGLVGALPGVRFSLLTLGGRSTSDEEGWAMPANVVRVQEYALGEGPLSKEKKGRGKIDVFELAEDLVEGLAQRSFNSVSSFYRAVIDENRRQVSPMEVWRQRKVQRFLAEDEEWQGIAHRLLRLVDLPLPKARVYHAVGGAFAALAGVLARQQYKVPLVYTALTVGPEEKTPQERRLAQLSRVLVCRSAGQLIALGERQRKELLRAGAHPGRVQVLPLGYSATSLPTAPAGPDCLTVELLGPVVPERDVDGFIRACPAVRQQLPAARFVIPTGAGDDGRYLQYCRTLVDRLGATDCIEFAPAARRPDRFGRAALVVSLGRGPVWPGELLAAQSRGCPCLVTDVGVCGEVVNGRSAEDLALGASGLLASLGRPDKLVEDLVYLLADGDLRRRMGQRARRRVERFYNAANLYSAYLQVYRDALTFGSRRPELNDRGAD